MKVLIVKGQSFVAKSAFQKCSFGKIREDGLEVRQSWKMSEEAKRKI